MFKLYLFTYFLFVLNFIGNHLYNYLNTIQIILINDYNTVKPVKYCILIPCKFYYDVSRSNRLK